MNTETRKTIHFHIGSGRCGSTLIQGLFNEPSLHQIFNHFSLKYDPDIYLEMAKIAPVYEFDKAVWQAFHEKYIRPLQSQPQNGFFITQENIFGSEHMPGRENTVDNSCRALEVLSQGFDLKIVAIIRRQDTYIESLYNQCLKRYDKRDFATFVDETPAENLDWKSILDTYAGLVGAENITVVPFERPICNSGNRKDFIDAVLKAIGIMPNIEIGGLPIANPSLAPRVSEIQLLANRMLSELEAHNLANWFMDHIHKQPDEPHELFNDTERRAYLNRYAASNRALVETYMPDFKAAGDYYTGGA